MKKRVLSPLLVLSLLLFGCAQQQGALIKDLVIGELEGNKHAMSFFAINKQQETIDCQVKINLDNELYQTFDLGTIKPNEKKFFETILGIENGKLEIKTILDCKTVTQKEIDACSNKKNAERKICMLTFNKPKLQQCLMNNVTDHQFFCIAFLNKDPELCTYIIPDSKKIWCKAYVTNNTDLCATIRDENDKDWCYADMGMNFEDKSVCEKITDEKSKTSCIAVATKRPELCLEGAERYKLNCILALIEATSNKELCTLLDKQKEECLKQIK